MIGFFFCNISEDYKKKQQDGDDNTQSMASLKWSTAELKVVSMSSITPRTLPLMKPRPLPLHLSHYCRTSTIIFSSFLIRIGYHMYLKKNIVGKKRINYQIRGHRMQDWLEIPIFKF